MDFASLQHSLFLHALGSAILNSLWQAFVLWFLYETICISYKSASARFRNNLSTILLFFSFSWFVSTLTFNIISQPDTFTPTVASSFTLAPATHNLSLLDQLVAVAGSALPYLSIAYIFLLMFLTGKLLTAYRYVYIISKRRLVAPPSELQHFAATVAKQMRITKKITVWISHHIDVPATIGFVKPIILVPFASLNNLSGEQLEAIILHELSHIKRNDYLINIFVSVIETVLFFNPFVVMLSKVIKRERENCCDDFVLQYRYDPHSYATALLRLEQSRISSLKFAIGAVSGKQQLLSRIKRITAGQAAVKPFNYGQKLAALIVITAIFCSVAWLSPAEKKVSTKDSSFKKEKKLASEKIISLAKAPRITASVQRITRTKTGVLPVNKNVPHLGLQDFKNFTTDADALSTDEPGFPYADAKAFAQSKVNLKQPAFFVDYDKLKIPASINIKNFPFGNNANFNIDLSQIDMATLNENLKQAYLEINAIDWKQIENEIEKSFADQKKQKFFTKKQLQSYIESAKHLLLLQQDKEKMTIPLLQEQRDRQIKLEDSINAKQIEQLYENAANVKEHNVRLQRLYRQFPKAPDNFQYSVTSNGGQNFQQNIVCNVPSIAASGAHTRNFNIAVKHPGKGRSYTQSSKVIQFSFDTNSDKETSKSKKTQVIQLEFTDIP